MRTSESEWQAWVARAGALRRAFISVKGFYYQAEVCGQPVTWLVPHGQLSQVRCCCPAGQNVACCRVMMKTLINPYTKSY